MKHILHSLLFILPFLVLSACTGKGTAPSADVAADTVAFKYAQRLTVVKYDGYTVATLANPWKEGKILHQYVIIPKGQELPPDLPPGTIVRTPLRRSVIFTTVHCSLLMMLQRQESIAGVADLKYIKIPYIHEQVDKGHIVDCGDGMSPVIEKIIDLHPDAIFLSPFENSGGYGKVEDIDIPIIECAEYMEPSPLARAEWMRFYGLLFGCEHEADSLFAVVDSSYQALRAMPKQKLTRQPESEAYPSVILDKVTGSVWYVPGGKSTIGQMIRDAGGRYPWAADEHSGSVSLPFETVLEKAGECDVWLFRFSSDHLVTYQELLAEHHGYSQFNAFRKHQVYGCNVELSQFYEESPFRPDFLLSDFIKILHPDILNLPPLRYYQKLNE